MGILAFHFCPFCFHFVLQKFVAPYHSHPKEISPSNINASLNSTVVQYIRVPQKTCFHLLKTVPPPPPPPWKVWPGMTRQCLDAKISLIINLQKLQNILYLLLPYIPREYNSKTPKACTYVPLPFYTKLLMYHTLFTDYLDLHGTYWSPVLTPW